MLSATERAALEAAAKGEGLDDAEVAALMEAANLDDEPAPAEQTQAAPAAADAKLYQYQLPYITVAELRRYLRATGVPLDDGDGNIPDASSPCAEWLAKHGGALGGGGGSPPDAPPTQ